MLEMFVGRILYGSSKILCRKTWILALRFVGSYWWMNLSHLAQHCHTFFINNFERINTFQRIRQFDIRPGLRLVQSSHQINLESFFHPTLIAFVADFEQVEFSYIMFCFSDTFYRDLFCLPWAQVYNKLIAL